MYNNALENPRTIRQLFQNLEEIRIPAYQRAYSWEQKHCEQFFEDLMEQNGKSYYLGQLLFEKDERRKASLLCYGCCAQK